jgi:hypothetical protein
LLFWMVTLLPSQADKPLQKETAQQREQLQKCFDQGDEIGETYHTMEGNGLAGMFSEDTQHRGLAREQYRDSECAKLQEGAKCQRACAYGFRFPHSYKGGTTLDELWKEEDFQLKNTPEVTGWDVLDLRRDDYSGEPKPNPTVSLSVLDGAVAGLNIDCLKPKSHMVTVVTNTSFDKAYSDVWLRLDDSKPMQQRWATGGYGLVAPESAQLINKMMGSKSLIVKFTLPHHPETTFTFNVAGLKEKLQPVAEICGL